MEWGMSTSKTIAEMEAPDTDMYGPPDDDRVPEHDGCPHCGETRVDYLVIDEDHVDCLSCSKGYWLYGVEVA